MKQLINYKTLGLLVCLLAFGCNNETSTPTSNLGTSNSSGFDNGSGSGTGGSLARFTIVNNHLFVVNDFKLFSYSIEDAKNPVLVSEIAIGFLVETLFSIDGHLLLGTQSGMEIYSIANPSSPSYVSTYRHIVSCDPVVAKNGFAYSTLRTGNACNRGVNRLDFISIQNLSNPQLLNSMVMNNPMGLGISGDYLFVCDNSKIRGMDITNPAVPVSIGDIVHEGCFDIIGFDNKIIVVGTNDVAQYSVSSQGQLSLLSKINLN